jgi:CRISPR/Cas system CSM-associated protein Csm4 (group 5 of RAMP superfamily)
MKQLLKARSICNRMVLKSGGSTVGKLVETLASNPEIHCFSLLAHMLTSYLVLKPLPKAYMSENQSVDC